MRLRLLCAAALAVVCVPSFATPTSITPGQTVTPGTGLFGGAIVDSVSSSNNAGTVAYSDTVYADPNNPLCAGCYDFVIQLQNFSTTKDATSVTTENFNGNKYSLDVAYASESSSLFQAPFDASESANGKQITFDFDLGYLGESDPLIIYTNAMGDQSGTLSITLGVVTDPPAFAPAGAAVTGVTPEPSSLLLLGTGALGFAGMVRRRLA